MVHQNSLRFYGDVAYERYGGLVLGHEEGARLARAWRSLPPCARAGLVPPPRDTPCVTPVQGVCCTAGIA